MNYIKYQLSNGTWIKTYAPDHKINYNHRISYCSRSRGWDGFAALIKDVHAFYDNHIPFEGYQIIKIEEGYDNEIKGWEISIT
jgi:hypothetical protein